MEQRLAWSLKCGGYDGEPDGGVMMVKWSHFELRDARVEL